MCFSEDRNSEEHPNSSIENYFVRQRSSKDQTKIVIPRTSNFLNRKIILGKYHIDISLPTYENKIESRISFLCLETVWQSSSSIICHIDIEQTKSQPHRRQPTVICAVSATPKCPDLDLFFPFCRNYNDGS